MTGEPMRGKPVAGSSFRGFAPPEEFGLTEEEIEAECPPTADGILQCLQMLAEEAAGLRLSRTLAAIEKALQICHEEGLSPAFPAGAALTLH